VRVLTVAEAREADRRAIEEIGVPGLVLMENAALGVVDALGARWPEARRIGLVCGPGNNGADGLAAARQLVTRGYDVAVLAATFGRSPSEDFRRQASILEGLGIGWREIPGDDRLDELDGVEVLVDALFGVGLSRPLEGDPGRLVDRLSGRAPTLAVDLPSGLDGDRAEPIGPFLPADLTGTFGAPKPAHVLGAAAEACGEVVVADLGVPLTAPPGAQALHLLVAEELGRALPVRPPAAHKGAFGHVLLVAGAEGKAGAAVLAARASIAAGAGLTTVASPRRLGPSLASGCPEAMSLPVDETASGALVETALETLVAAAAERTVVAVGPGIGREETTERLVRELVRATDRPLVLDADGLNAFAGRIEELAARPGPTVLTPHPGEAARLLGRSTGDVQADRLGAVRELARRAAAVVALKGAGTLVASPEGEVWINRTGNPGMATGGSGDVLTGVVAARLAQGDTAEFAAALAVHWHGLAGDLAAERVGGPAVAATDLLADLGPAFARLVEA